MHAATDALAKAVSEPRVRPYPLRRGPWVRLRHRPRLQGQKGLILARKPNKLPRETIEATYELEVRHRLPLEAHADAIKPGTRVLVTDDLLATGGTARAMCELVENAGGIVAGVAFLIELGYLEGRDEAKPYEVISLINYNDPDE